LFSTENMEVIHLHQTVESTQEEAKRILEERISKSETSDIPTMIAVLADGQSKGRGTSGRSWVTTQGNLFLTCAFPMDKIPLSKITMLPLGCGVVIADQLNLHSRVEPTLKWPNDVLLDGFKVAGTLIENWTIQNQTWWLVGIGVNVESHPQELVKDKEDALAIPRAAVSLKLYAANETTIPTAPEFGVSIAGGLLEFLQTIQSSSSSTIVRQWKSYSQLNVPYTIRNSGEVVQVKDIESDGRLRVLGSNGQERFLSTDYFY